MLGEGAELVLQDVQRPAADRAATTRTIPYQRTGTPTRENATGSMSMMGVTSFSDVGARGASKRP
jgi:hypothetical protein